MKYANFYTYFNTNDYAHRAARVGRWIGGFTLIGFSAACPPSIPTCESDADCEDNQTCFSVVEEDTNNLLIKYCVNNDVIGVDGGTDAGDPDAGDAGEDAGEDAGDAGADFPTPTIDVFSATPNLVEIGTNTTLKWETKNASSCTLTSDQDDTPQVFDGDEAEDGSIIATINEPTTFTLECKNQDEDPEVVTKEISVDAKEKFTVSTSLFLENGAVDEAVTGFDDGESGVLRWSVAGDFIGCTVFEDGASVSGTVSNRNGSFELGILNESRNLELHCEGPLGDDDIPIEIPVARIVSFTPSASLIADGGSVNFTVTAENVGNCTIEGQAANSNFTPATDQDFVVLCSGFRSGLTATASVNVLRIASFTSNLPKVAAGQSVTLNWTSEHAESCALSANVSTVDEDVAANASSTQIINDDDQFILTCKNGEVQTEKTLNVAATVVINQFESHITGNSLDKVTLSWTPKESANCGVKDESNNTILAPSANNSVEINKPANDGIKTYTLTCNDEDSTNSAATKTVKVFWGNTNLNNLHAFNNIELIVGNIDTDDDFSAQNLDALSKIREVKKLDISNSILTKIEFPALQLVLGATIFDHDSANNTLTEIKLPALTRVSGAFSVENATALTTLNLQNLGSIGGAFSLQNANALTTLSLQNLVSVGGAFSVENATALTTLNLQNLVSVSGNFTVSDNNTLSSIQANSIQTITGKAIIRRNPQLECNTLLRIRDAATSKDIGENKNGCSL